MHFPLDREPPPEVEPYARGAVPAASTNLLFGCALAYRIAAPTPFIPNGEVAKIATHRNLREKRAPDRGLPRHSITVAPFGSRDARLTVPPGPLPISHCGERTAEAIGPG